MLEVNRIALRVRLACACLHHLGGPQPSYAKASEGLIVSPAKLRSSEGGSRAMTGFLTVEIPRVMPGIAPSVSHGLRPRDPRRRCRWRPPLRWRFAEEEPRPYLP